MTEPFTIGGDPEVFIKVKNKFVSAEDHTGPVIPGTKEKPFKVKNGMIQVDGVACEFNINPSNTFENFCTSILDVSTELKKRVKEKYPEAELAAVPTAYFDEDYFFKLPEKVLKLGCDPDFNAYTGKPNNPPETKEAFRTGSGHIAIGWRKDGNKDEEGHLEDCKLVVKQLDKYLYFASLDWDKDEKRRTLYGAKGAFRPTSFGVEYRPTSNAWLRKSSTVKDVYDITQKLMQQIDSGNLNLDFEIENMYGNTNTQKVKNTLGIY